MIHHHDKLGHSHSEAQKEGNNSSKHQFSSETALECNTEIHWHHLVPFRLLGITHPYIFLSCNLPHVSRFCQPPHEATMLTKGRSLLDQISLPLPHHLNCSQDPCVMQLGVAARSPSELLQESYYLHHHGLSDVRSRRNNLNKKKWRKLRRQLLHIEYSPLSWGK